MSAVRRNRFLVVSYRLFPCVETLLVLQAVAYVLKIVSLFFAQTYPVDVSYLAAPAHAAANLYIVNM